MHFSFSYTRNKVLQALRYHFIAQTEIRVMFIVIIIFDLISAILYFKEKFVRSLFYLGICLVLFIFRFGFLCLRLFISVLQHLEKHLLFISAIYISLENKQGRVEWEWNRFIKYFESPNFFHLYFSAKSFFLVPKESLNSDQQHELRIY